MNRPPFVVIEGRQSYESLRNEQRKLERRANDRRQRKEQGLAKERTIKRTSHPKDTASRRPFKMARRRSRDASLGREIHKRDGRHRSLLSASCISMISSVAPQCRQVSDKNVASSLFPHRQT